MEWQDNFFTNTNGIISIENGDDRDTCGSCGQCNWVYTRDGDRVCSSCGVVDGDYRELVMVKTQAQTDTGRAPYNESNENEGYNGDGEYDKTTRRRGGFGRGTRRDRGFTKELFNAIKATNKTCFRSSGTLRGRYKHIFHYNERIAQWIMLDPPINNDVRERIREEALTGKYGSISDFTRSTIVTIVKNLKLTKYRERWKTLLWDLWKEWAPEQVDNTPLPTHQLILKCENAFRNLVIAFTRFRRDMPKNIIKGKSRYRHNFPNYNYTHRKILEAFGVYDFHWEFPIPRSWKKVKVLDDVMEKMMQQLGMKFQRSVYMKRPKQRKHKKTKTVKINSDVEIKTNNNSPCLSQICLAGADLDNPSTWDSLSQLSKRLDLDLPFTESSQELCQE